MDTVSLKDHLSRRAMVVRLACSSMDAGTGVEEMAPPLPPAHSPLALFRLFGESLITNHGILPLPQIQIFT